MQTKIIEATNGPRNWGKFLVGRFDEQEWLRCSVPCPAIGMRLLEQIGWTPLHLFVLDLQTGEGAIFKPGGYPKADLDKHKIWVCPLFEPFLEWLYHQDLRRLEGLPDYIDLPTAPFQLYGSRRQGVTQGG